MNNESSEPSDSLTNPQPLDTLTNPPVSSDCWHCSLVSYSVSQSVLPDAQTVSTHFLPGAIFLTLAVRWSLLLTWRWSRSAAGKDPELAGINSTTRSCSSRYLQSLPWEGILKLILTGLGIILTVALSPGQHNQDEQYVTNIRLTTIYLFFALSGLVDIFIFYCGYTVLPEGLQSFILSLAFAVEAVMFGSTLGGENPVEHQVHALLIVAIACASLSSAMEVIFDNKLVKFCRTFFCFTQGSWLVHGGFLVKKDSTSVSPEWITILFSWHIAAIFIAFTTVLLISSLFHKKSSPDTAPLTSARSQSSSPHTTHTNSSPSSTSDLSFQQKHVPILSSEFYNTASTGLSVLPPIIHKEKCATPSTGPPSVIESQPCDQISTNQEYQNVMMARHDGIVPHYRASIKLKDSKLI